ncbi:rRNA maturation RNase YbeY [Algoriphagus sp. AGSA1]|uniref:rRNA maturation RNase YbeY n=1 Tax=Algoriphagus sp. AGSA1 TaxID=2907213 RepID=UPI001F3F619A|nr:rRNA maturation RNase YbeY [Algoriphagus sp. AGSA1]MCE7055349.1 rRNA maturation RNase YbeY [Algoriphagus sp. AGSA1]
MAINFFIEEISFALKNRRRRKAWLRQLALSENHDIAELNYIFCSDDYLLTINKEYLNHDTFTDIITFDNSEEEGVIEGDIFISIDRVKDNARTLKIQEEEELNRVISHGLLHLLGYKDKTKAQSVLMRNKEDFAISLYEKT